MFCSLCGSALQDRNTCCPSCGVVTDEEDSPEQSAGDRGLLVAGYICAIVALFFLPPAFALAAFVIAVINLTRNRIWHGIVQIALAVTFGVTGMMLGAFWWNSPPDWISRHGHGTEPISVARSTAPVYNLGQIVSVGYWSYQVLDSRWQPFIASSFGTIERPDAAFLIVGLRIRNDDRTLSNRPPLKLLDQQGREYDETTKFTEGELSILKQLNPTVASSGYVIFDVPRGNYMLKVSGGYESDAYALVNLPPVQIAESQITARDSDAPVQQAQTASIGTNSNELNDSDAQPDSGVRATSSSVAVKPPPTIRVEGFEGEVYGVGGPVIAPRATYAPDANDSEEARRGRYEGTVSLWLIVDAAGYPRDVRVSRSLGDGPDDAAVEAVKNWRFQPAIFGRHPVPVAIAVEVKFRPVQ